MSDLVGHKLGPYEITALIGRGGMATVYLAQQPSMSRMVAVKVLPPQLLHEETFLQRFRREVQAVARLQHPRIIPVYDYGEDGEIPYIVMAYIEGGSLAERIKDQGGLAIDETGRLIAQIAEGLDYAHHVGIIHRDFKPSNVLLDKQGNAYLSDFGIAKVSQETMQLTGSGIVGTPTYMAPEMFKQEDATPSVDIYALGVTLYQMLSGDAPFSGTTPVQLMYAHLNEPIPAIAAARPDMPPQVQAVIDRAMAKNPAARYPTAGALAGELALAARGELPILDEHTMPLTDIIRAGTATAAPVPTGKVDEAPAPSASAPPPTPAVSPLSAGVAQVAELASQAKEMERRLKREEQEAREREKAEKKARQKDRRRDWEGRPRRRNLWFLWLILGVLIVAALCKGASTIGGLVGSAVSSGVNSSHLDGTPASGAVHQTLDGATSLEVNVSVGTGSVSIDAADDESIAAEGDYTGHGDLKVDKSYKITNGKGTLNITQQTPNPDNPGLIDTFALSLTKAVPLELMVSAGASESDLDLSGMMLSGLSVKGGVGKFTITLPSSGSYAVNVTIGGGEADLLIPDTVEARLDLTGGLSSIEVADERFKSGSNNVWETPGYQDASERVKVTITAGAGKVLVDKP